MSYRLKKVMEAINNRNEQGKEVASFDKKGKMYTAISRGYVDPDSVDIEVRYSEGPKGNGGIVFLKTIEMPYMGNEDKIEKLLGDVVKIFDIAGKQAGMVVSKLR